MSDCAVCGNPAEYKIKDTGDCLCLSCRKNFREVVGNGVRNISREAMLRSLKSRITKARFTSTRVWRARRNPKGHAGIWAEKKKGGWVGYAHYGDYFTGVRPTKEAALEDVRKGLKTQRNPTGGQDVYAVVRDFMRSHNNRVSDERMGEFIRKWKHTHPNIKGDLSTLESEGFMKHKGGVWYWGIFENPRLTAPHGSGKQQCACPSCDCDILTKRTICEYCQSGQHSVELNSTPNLDVSVQGIPTSPVGAVMGNPDEGDLLVKIGFATRRDAVEWAKDNVRAHKYEELRDGTWSVYYYPERTANPGWRPFLEGDEVRAVSGEFEGKRGVILQPHGVGYFNVAFPSGHATVSGRELRHVNFPKHNPEGPAAKYDHHRQIPPQCFHVDSYATVPLHHTDYPRGGKYDVPGAQSITGRLRKGCKAKFGKPGVRVAHRSWGIQSILTPKSAGLKVTGGERALENPSELYGVLSVKVRKYGKRFRAYSEWAKKNPGVLEAKDLDEINPKRKPVKKGRQTRPPAQKIMVEEEKKPVAPPPVEPPKKKKRRGYAYWSDPDAPFIGEQKIVERKRA